MKKITMFLVAVMTLCFTACSSNSEETRISLLQNDSHEKDFAELKRLSLYHSQGLDAIYSHLASSTTRTVDKKITKGQIARLSVNFINAVPDFQTTNTRNSVDISLSNPASYELTEKAEQIFKTYFNRLINSLSKADIENYVDSIVRTENFLSLNKEEQSLLAFMMYIGIDSGAYWSNPYNWKKWESLKHDSIFVEDNTPVSRGIAGPSTYYWMTPGQRSDRRFQKVLRDDCLGCIGSLFMGFTAAGWAIGGIYGSACSTVF